MFIVHKNVNENNYQKKTYFPEQRAIIINSIIISWKNIRSKTNFKPTKINSQLQSEMNKFFEPINFRDRRLPVAV